MFRSASASFGLLSSLSPLAVFVVVAACCGCHCRRLSLSSLVADLEMIRLGDATG